ncbi:hypothetical protein GMA8713_02654 [Grimontia marina]|uniref:Uncharacterized protein n=1 Tax=Grimontia marina TaxID=646534 RepID=A0A128FAP1_9GAMM|nr:hypothetical protein GMA8713_02654 [Grimontia marina]
MAPFLFLALGLKFCFFGLLLLQSGWNQFIAVSVHQYRHRHQINPADLNRQDSQRQGCHSHQILIDGLQHNSFLLGLFCFSCTPGVYISGRKSQAESIFQQPIRHKKTDGSCRFLLVSLVSFTDAVRVHHVQCLQHHYVPLQ